MTTGDEQQLRPPWERLLPANGKRGESDVAFAALCAYCKLPEGEDNLRRLADTLGNPGRVGIIGAATYPMLKDVTLRTMLEILEEKRIRFTYRKDDHVLTLLHNKAIILFRSLDRPETLRGSTLAWIGVDELTYCRDSDGILIERWTSGFRGVERARSLGLASEQLRQARKLEPSTEGGECPT